MIKIEDLKVGMKVKLKNQRGFDWNSKGKMDRYMGRIVKIRSIKTFKDAFEIEQDVIDDDKYWLFGINDIEEIIKEDKLKVKVWNYKNVVLYEVLEQDEDLRCKHSIFKASNGWEILSYSCPAITQYSVCIKGDVRDKDKDVVVWETGSIKEAKRFVEEIKQAVKEFNEKDILDDGEKKYLSSVIKPFRDDIRNIVKKSINSGKEWIIINFKDGDSMNFKMFKTDTMYKGMIRNKRYSLQELGL